MNAEDRPWLKFYPEGAPADIDPPKKSLPEIFDESFEKYSDRTAIIFEGNEIKYKELKDLVDRFATALSELGVEKGDKVALYLPNCPQYPIAYVGALKAGATVTPISPVYVSKEVAHQLTNSGAKTIVCLDSLYDKVEMADVELENVITTNIGEYLPTMKKFLGKVFGNIFSKLKIPEPELPEEGIIDFQDLIEEYPPDPPKIEFDPMEDIAVLPYTGGTTGLPKGVMLTHSNVATNTAQVQAYWPMMKEGEEVMVGFLPFYHIYGQVVVLLSGLGYGQTVIVFTTPDLDDILDAIQKHGVTIFNGVPTVYEYLLDHDKTQRIDWKRMKVLTSGADTLYESTAEEWKELTGTMIAEGYGLTETSPVTHSNPPDNKKIGSMGIPIPNTLAAIADPEGDKLLPQGEIGEIVIHGPQVMQGYWEQPEENEEAFSEINGEKWLRTGDLATMDEDGYFFFEDRKKNLIKYKGYSVFSRDVEEVLYNHPKVKEAGVIGVPDPKVGQIVKAVVVLETEARGKVSEDELTEYCEENLAHYKVPKIVEFRGEIPKTDVGKVSHRELKEEVE